MFGLEIFSPYTHFLFVVLPLTPVNVLGERKEQTHFFFFGCMCMGAVSKRGYVSVRCWQIPSNIEALPSVMLEDDVKVSRFHN